MLIVSMLAASMVGIFAVPTSASDKTDVEYAEIHGDVTKLTGVKKEYVAGEPVMVTPYGSGENWIGIYRPADYGSSYWLYIDTAKGGAGSGVAIDISKGNELYPGKYIIRVMPKDGPHDTALAWTEITVLPKEGQNYDMTALVQGDATKLSLEKGTYESGEPIPVKAVGSGKDWVGIYKVCVQASIKWHYIDTAKGGPGSGIEKDVTQGTVLEPGEYVVRVMPNDQSAHGRAVAWAVITVTEPKAVVPDAPTSATYTPSGSGFAGGTVKVEMPDFNADDRRDIVMYWANESGKLVGYTALAKFKITGKTTEHKLADGLMIPNGATKLYVYSMHTKTGTLSEKFVTVELPKDSDYEKLGDPLMEFQIVSDIHVTGTAANEYTANYIKMLNDIAANSKKSQGIFVVGDIAHNGYESEYQLAAQLYAEVKGLPKMYYGIGNHDLWNHGNSIDEATKLFCKYAVLPDGSHPTDSSYDFWLGGYHFIFLGTDFYNSLTASFNMNTINWFESVLTENRDPERPIFVMLHQSLKNTVSGSLDGQGWDGVEATSATLLKRVLVKYPEILMFNGHSHWTLDSESCMYGATEELPINIFNTASVAYLWTSYDVTEGVRMEGSQGYYIRVYEDRVLILGRDFITGEWVSSAQFCVEFEQTEDEPPVSDTETETNAPTDTNVPTDTNSPTDTNVPSDSTDTPNVTTTNAPSTSEPAKKSCGGMNAAAVIAIMTVSVVGAAIAVVKKK